MVNTNFSFSSLCIQSSSTLSKVGTNQKAAVMCKPATKAQNRGSDVPSKEMAQQSSATMEDQAVRSSEGTEQDMAVKRRRNRNRNRSQAKMCQQSHSETPAATPKI